MEVSRCMRFQNRVVSEMRKKGPSMVRFVNSRFSFRLLIWCFIVKATCPLVRITIPDARFTCLDWANSEVMAIGCSNGMPSLHSSR